MSVRAYRQAPSACTKSELQPGLCQTHNCWAWSTKSEVCLEYRAQAAEARVDELDYDFGALTIHAKGLVARIAALEAENRELEARCASYLAVCRKYLDVDKLKAALSRDKGAGK